MAELLLEILSEEIPARMQNNAAKQLRDEVAKALNGQAIYHSNIQAFATPRRLVLVADNISMTQEASSSETRGPRVGCPEQALEGFLRSTGLSKEQLVTKETPKGEFYFAVVQQAGKHTKDILTPMLQGIIQNFHWPKSMRWGNGTQRWVRPMRNLTCLFGSEILPITFADLKANDTSVGHRFLAPDRFHITDFKGYKADLKARYVMLDGQERQEHIKQEVAALLASKNLKLVEDVKLLEEVAGLVEYPVCLMGSIDQKFMSLPEEVLISSIRTHQKYFCTRQENGELAPYFIVVSNMKTDDGGKQIIHGNERVLRARLSDALFFWEQDVKQPLEALLPKLERVVFHARLGTLEQKTNRIVDLAGYFAKAIPNAPAQDILRAAKLCKTDLASEMVGEFPELQGIMGAYYAHEHKESDNVARAVAEHYQPVGADDRVPSVATSVAVSIADKLDSLVGLFAANEQPTGSKDPFALRRAALGIIRTTLENKLSYSLTDAVEHALMLYPRELFSKDDEGLLSKMKSKPAHFVATRDAVLEFFMERIKALLKSQNIRHDLISAVMATGEDNILYIVQRIAALSAFLNNKDGADLLVAYRRGANILASEVKKEGKPFKPAPASNLLDKDEEIALYDAIKASQPVIHKAIDAADFEAAMQELATLRAPVDNFFDQVIVNAEDPDIRKNRLRLLASLHVLFSDIADFSAIEGGDN